MNGRLVFGIFVFTMSWAVSADGQGAKFTVASIHPTEPGEVERGLAPSIVSGPGTGDSGRITYLRMPLAGLISLAYETTADRVIGPQPSMRSVYDVTATLEPDSRKKDLPAMLRALLEERFELKTHVEQKSTGMYRIVVAKGGIKFKESHPEPSDAPLLGVGAADKDGFPILPSSYTGIVARASNDRLLLRGQNVTIAELIKWLEPSLGRGAVDDTGLQGKYDFKLLFRSALPSGNPTPASQNENDPGDTVFDAISQLGLRPETISDNLDFVVVDSVRKDPLPN
jgi:uncharacterized protein (TIGR03435 family)